MKHQRLTGAICATGLALLIAGSANAAGINYTTNSPLTKFTSGVNSLTLSSVSGQAAALTFTPNTVSNSGVPSNINLGDFLLVCSTCTVSQTTTFGSFTFDLVVTDITDGGAQGVFTGTSSGGTVSSDSSTINITFGPVSFGPGTFNALSGNFGDTIFSKLSPVTSIVAPNSGTPAGDSTVQAQLSSTTPEPASFVLFGCALAGLGLMRGKLVSR